MKLITVDKEHIKKTVEWWQNHTYATHSDIGRVERFRKLNADTATYDEVTVAYGGTGWAQHKPCAECGDVEMDHVLIGNVEVCASCVDAAVDLCFPKAPELPKQSIFKFWK